MSSLLQSPCYPYTSQHSFAPPIPGPGFGASTANEAAGRAQVNISMGRVLDLWVQFWDSSICCLLVWKDYLNSQIMFAWAEHF